MQLNLPEPLKSEVQALAQQKGVTVETIVMQAVEYYLTRQSDMKTRARKPDSVCKHLIALTTKRT